MKQYSQTSDFLNTLEILYMDIDIFLCTVYVFIFAVIIPLPMLTEISNYFSGVFFVVHILNCRASINLDPC